MEKNDSKELVYVPRAYIEGVQKLFEGNKELKEKYDELSSRFDEFVNSIIKPKEGKRIEVCYYSVSELNHGFENPRKAPSPKRKQALEESLTKLGDFGVIVIDENLSIISGNQRTKILLSLDPGRKVLCKKLIGYSDSEKKAINIKANTHAGEWDTGKLAEWVGDFKLDMSTDLTALKQKEPYIKDMELMRFEKYDYVLVVCRNEPDYNNLLRLLNLENKKLLVRKKKDQDRALKARAIWYEDFEKCVTAKKK